MLVVIHGNKRGHSEILRFELKGTGSLGKPYYTKDFGGVLRTLEKGVGAYSLHFEEEIYVLSLAHSIYDWTRRPGSWVVVSIVAPYDRIIQNAAEILKQVIDLYLEHYLDRDSYQLKRVTEDKALFQHILDEAIIKVASGRAFHQHQPGDVRGLILYSDDSELTDYFKHLDRPSYNNYKTILFLAKGYRDMGLNLSHLQTLSVTPVPSMCEVDISFIASVDGRVLRDITAELLINDVRVGFRKSLQGLYVQDKLTLNITDHDYYKISRSSQSILVGDLQGAERKEWRIMVDPILHDIRFQVKLPDGVHLGINNIRPSSTSMELSEERGKGTVWKLRNVELSREPSITIDHDRLKSDPVEYVFKRGDENDVVKIDLRNEFTKEWDNFGFSDGTGQEQGNDNGKIPKKKKSLGLLNIVLVILLVVLASALVFIIYTEDQGANGGQNQREVKKESEPEESGLVSGDTTKINGLNRGADKSQGEQKKLQAKIDSIQTLANSADFRKQSVELFKMELEAAQIKLNLVLKDTASRILDFCSLLEYETKKVDTVSCTFESVTDELPKSGLLSKRLDDLIMIVDHLLYLYDAKKETTKSSHRQILLSYYADRFLSKEQNDLLNIITDPNKFTR